MTNLGTISPRLMAKTIVTAVMPSAIVALTRSNVVCAPLASCRRPLAALKTYTPGSIDTTEAKPMAANGMCQWRATGVMISPTARQATKAPIAALELSTASAPHRSAWANMPTATGHANMCIGVEKKTL